MKFFNNLKEAWLGLSGNQKITLVTLVVMLLAVPLGVFLATGPVKLFSRANYPVTPPITPPQTPPSEADSRVFVTSNSYSGNLGGYLGADAKCQKAASSAGLGGKWKAWLSDRKSDAYSRMYHSSGRYVLIDGTVIAQNWDDLVDQTILHPINVDEKGNIVTSVTLWNVWTNTRPDGHIYNTQPRSTCNNWTSSGKLFIGNGGSTSEVNYGWTLSDKGGRRCDSPARLYCFEQLRDAPISSIIPRPKPTPISSIIPRPKPTPYPVRNKLPIITTTYLPTAVVGRKYKATISGYDPDWRDNLKMVITGLPKGIEQLRCTTTKFRLRNTINCIVEGNPSTPGVYNVTVRLFDSKGGSDVSILKLRVKLVEKINQESVQQKIIRIPKIIKRLFFGNNE